MSEADKMFEALDYSKSESFFSSGYVSSLGKKIFFSTESSFVELTTGRGSVLLSMDELKAINKKCEELGWLDKE